MDELTKVMKVFSNKLNIRIFKILNKKMLSLEQISQLFDMNTADVKPLLEELESISVIKKIKGNPDIYHSKNTSSIFSMYAKDVVILINKWFNSNKDIVDDFNKINKIKL